ncbi:MAG: Rv3654c family TadE-like protein, partial [Dermatophilaceae bacterium]
ETRSAHERGSGTVLALGLMVVLCAVLLAGVALCGAVVAAHRAAAAADLAALAGAQTLSGGSDVTQACVRAATIAGAQAAEVMGCQVRGEEVEVKVSVRVPWAQALIRQPAVARARAGPAPVVR